MRRHRYTKAALSDQLNVVFCIYNNADGGVGVIKTYTPITVQNYVTQETVEIPDTNCNIII